MNILYSFILITIFFNTPEAKLTPLLSGPVNIYYTKDGHFRIFYTLSGEDAVPSEDKDPANGVPDYIDKIANGAEFAWQKIIDEFQWRAPERGVIDVYVKKISASGYGSSGEIYISNKLLLQSDLGSLLAHEFMHAVEGAYDEESPWWEEAVAEWMSHLLYGLFDENIVFFSLQLNLMDRLGKNYLSLYDYKMAYANSLWVWFLQEWAGKGDQAIIRRMWERAGEVPGENTLESIDYVLQDSGRDLLSAFQEFTVWNYFIGPYDDGKHYPEGDEISSPYGSVRIDNRHESYPVTAHSLNNPYPLGANYIELIPDPNFAGAEMEFYGEAGVNWGISVIFSGQNGGSKIEHRRADENGYFHTVFPDWNRYKRIIIVVQNLNTSGERASNYNYEIRGGDFHEEEGCGCSASGGGNDIVYFLMICLAIFLKLFLFRNRGIKFAGKRP